MSTEYIQVRQDDEYINGVALTCPPPAVQRRSRVMTVLPWSLVALALAFYTLIIFSKVFSKTCWLSSGENPLNAPIQWEERTYLTNIKTGVFDPYSTANPNVEEAWKALIDTHITTITEEEKQNLPGHRNTARAYGNEPGYAVLIEVFHQLHCLNAIRKSYYSGNKTDDNRGFSEPGGHSDHCFSYLLQTLLCHADVGVMTTMWNTRAHVFMADFNVTKQCRNYDLIKSWAQTRKAKFSPPPRVSM
ncbi:hypothetical protein VFPPC_16944 [Pochonia chlamydosporia 170]|uniref:Tat pathway signal sequence n=1 Tax=Pochonia chlamydosporia 170 TaxID=1380566 RepID=A0A179F0V2_METCM|nr:hypothetical protein VFPPC_16944 [Pochonia chlamydosporia 170]OAQ58713.2 hypothetical protein VFPPC_16944 [Pochonia chlamydosporia 170]